MATSTIESFSLSAIFVEAQHVGTPIVEICQYMFTPNPPSLIIKYDSATDYETEELDLVPIRPSVQTLRILDVNGKGQKIAKRPSQFLDCIAVQSFPALMLHLSRPGKNCDAGVFTPGHFHVDTSV